MKTFAFSTLNANEVSTSASRIEQIIIECIGADPFIDKVSIRLKQQMTGLTKAIGRTIDKSYVERLNEVHNIRDTRFIALRDFCKALVVDADPKVAAEAKKLVAIIRAIGWVIHESGAARETSLFASLIEKFDKGPGNLSLKAIGGVAKLNDLKTAQANFETTNKEKTDAKTKEEYPLIRDCRKGVARYLGAILVYIDLLAEIDGGVFADATARIDAVITEFESMAHNRQTRKENQKKKQDPGKTE